MLCTYSVEVIFHYIEIEISTLFLCSTEVAVFSPRHIASSPLVIRSPAIYQYYAAKENRPNARSLHSRYFFKSVAKDFIINYDYLGYSYHTYFVEMSIGSLLLLWLFELAMLSLLCTILLPVMTSWHGTFFAPWWRHQMETFSELLALCVGNSPVTGEFPAQRPVTRGLGFDVFFDVCLNEGWINNRGAGDTVMLIPLTIGQKSFDAALSVGLNQLLNKYLSFGWLGPLQCTS